MEYKVDELLDILKKLESYISNASDEHINELLRSTKYITKKIRNIRTKDLRVNFKKNVVHYVKIWFRLFLGARDECLVLLNGALRRTYYKKEFEAYEHKRDKEFNFHDDTKLSKFSTDGIDYEYRQIVKYGDKSVCFILF
jgi:hypothetical protein